ESEVQRYQAAGEAVRNDLRALGEKLSSQLRPAEQALFDVYIRILDDSALSVEVISHIQKGLWAQSALKRVVQEYVRHFELMGDDYLRERAVDIKDLGRRVLAHLQKNVQERRTYPKNTILVSEELTPSMLAEVPKGRLAGLVSVRG